jgi:hypothetical protein
MCPPQAKGIEMRTSRKLVWCYTRMGGVAIAAVAIFGVAFSSAATAVDPPANGSGLVQATVATAASSIVVRLLPPGPCRAISRCFDVVPGVVQISELPPGPCSQPGAGLCVDLQTIVGGVPGANPAPNP